MQTIGCAIVSLQSRHRSFHDEALAIQEWLASRVSEKSAYAPDSFTVGVLDQKRKAFLKESFLQQGVRLRDGSGRSLLESPLFSFLSCLRSYLSNFEIREYSELISQRDFLHFFAKQTKLPAWRILAALDTFRERHLCFKRPSKCP